jgi:hypothetical protein
VSGAAQDLGPFTRLAEAFDLSPRAFHDAEVSDHLLDLANLYFRILSRPMFANRETWERLLAESHDPVVRALFAGMSWGTVIKHRPDVHQGYGARR